MYHNVESCERELQGTIVITTGMKSEADASFIDKMRGAAYESDLRMCFQIAKLHRQTVR
jgi:hypothetical protein